MSVAGEAEQVPISATTAFDSTRLRAIHATGLLDGFSDVLDGLARAASQLVSAPLVLVNLPTPTGLRLIGMTGATGEAANRRTLPLSRSLCDVVVQTETPLIIDDLVSHPLGQQRPGMQQLGVRSYLAVPISSRRGRTLAAFSAYDRTTRVWTAEQIAGLEDLARAAAVEIELRISRRQRRSREQRFTAFMDHSPFIAALINDRGELEYANATFELHAGTSASTLAGTPLATLAFPLAPAIEAHANAVLRDGANIERTEQVISSSGDTRHWQLYAFAVEGEDERRAGVVAVDITERRQLEGQLQRAQRLESIGQLAAGIAHEINTPVQYVSDNVRFLADSFDRMRRLLDPVRPSCTASSDDASLPCALQGWVDDRLSTESAAFLQRELPSALSQSLDGLNRIAGIVRSVKQFSHPGTSAAALADINHALSLALTITRNEWRYVAECRTDFDPALPLTRCFVTELNQVFLNLLVNAGDAMRDSGRPGQLRVATQRDGAFVVIEIADTGTGIPAGIADRVFDPFFTTKAVGSGTGQGLAIAHAVVDRHGGTIRFRSVEGQGTTFEVRLPIAGPTSP
jgi:PAS domain S-box-containing protein